MNLKLLWNIKTNQTNITLSHIYIQQLLLGFIKYNPNDEILDFWYHIQFLGIITPEARPWAFLQWEADDLLMYLRLMFFNVIPVQWLLPLQSSFIATGVADVPFMFAYVTPLIFTPELYMINHNQFSLEKKNKSYIRGLSYAKLIRLFTWLGQPFLLGQ